MYFSPSDFLPFILWPVGLFFGVWGIVIGWRRDRLAKRIAIAYGIVGIASQIPMIIDSQPFWSGEYQSIPKWLISVVPAVLCVIAFGVGCLPAREAESTDASDHQGE